MPAASDLLFEPPMDREDQLKSVRSSAGEKLCTFTSISERQRHEPFFHDAVNILLEDAVFKGTSRENRVLEWKDPEKLMQLLDLKLEESPVTHDKLLSLIKDTIKYSVKTGHPYFVNQLFSR